MTAHRPFRKARAQAPLLSLALAAAFWLAGCAGAAPPSPYPHEFVLTVIAELKLNLAQDPYRFAPGKDLQGRNIYRVTLARLDSLDELADPAYADSLAFARGECLERLGAWTDAAAAFDRATTATAGNAAGGDGGSLAAQAKLRSEAARKMGKLVDRASMERASIEAYLNDLEVMGRRLTEWAGENPVWPYASFAKLEAARGREERALILFDNRRVLRDGAERAIQAAESLPSDFADSWRVSEHWLAVGGLYERLARDWNREVPPDGPPGRDDGRWRQWIDHARIAYRKAALADGDPAKPEGEARLRALDAYALRMQDLSR